MKVALPPFGLAAAAALLAIGSLGMPEGSARADDDKSISQKAVDVGTTVKRDTKEAAQAIAEKSKEVGKAVAADAKEVGQTVAKEAKKTGKAVAQGAKKAKDTVTAKKKDETPPAKD